MDTKLREEVIYDWFLKNEKLTGHNSEPLKFAQRLLNAAKAYSHFASNQNASGGAERGIVNTRLLGGELIKQHFIILMRLVDTCRRPTSRGCVMRSKERCLSGSLLERRARSTNVGLSMRHMRCAVLRMRLSMSSFSPISARASRSV